MFRITSDSAIRSRILRRIAASTALSGALLLPHLAQAQTVPTGGTVVSGGVTIATPAANSEGGLTVSVSQTDARGIINWQSFSVGQFDRVRFSQPSATAATLNRVTGGTASTISGQVSANGVIYLVNPNGIAITPRGTVQTGGGFVASTLAITDADFNDTSTTTRTFTGSGSSARVSNAGFISVNGNGNPNGIIALLGGTISNSGSLIVDTGRIALGSGEAMTLDVNGGNFLQIATPTNAIAANGAALIEAGGRITVRQIASTGTPIQISAATAANAVRTAINMTGALSATNATGNGSSIVLSGGAGGAVNVTGSITSRGSTSGGIVSVFGDRVALDGATFDVTASNTGASGGSLTASGSSVTANGTLVSALNTASAVNFMATSAGSGDGAIRIAAPLTSTGSGTVNWQARTEVALAGLSAPGIRATFRAGGNVAYTGTVSSSGPINLALFDLGNGNWVQNAATLPTFAARDFRFTQSNATFLRAAGGDGSAATPYRIVDVYGLQGMASSNQLAGNFVLVGTINASGTVNWNAGEGFVGIGGSTPFSGALSGANGAGRYAIGGLTQNRGGLGGLFSALSGTVSDLRLTGASISVISGGVLAYSVNAGGRISNVDVAGVITGTGNNVGGLIGLVTGGTIVNARAAVTVTGGGSVVGGLIGDMIGGTSVTGSSATGNVTGSGGNVGGLVGRQTATGSVVSTITNSLATGEVRGVSQVGGLVGLQTAATGGVASISGSQAKGAVTSTVASNGVAGVGGLVGQQTIGATTTTTTTVSIVSSYATGPVTTVGTYAGGLVGYQTLATSAGTLTIDRSYATGDVSGTNSVGGLVGFQSSNTTGNTAGILSISNAYATGNVRGVSQVGGLVGQQTGRAAAAPTIDYSYATGNVLGRAFVGGLIGNQTFFGRAANAYATGSVGVNTLDTATLLHFGGLIGAQQRNASAQYVYATGAVNASGASNVGGLVGLQNNGTASVSDAYASGAVTGDTNVGGLIGNRTGIVTRSYWDSYSTGQADAAGGGGADAGATAVTSAPGSANAYTAGSYTFTAASGIGTANANGFVFLPGNNARPFLAFEVPTAARVGVVPGDLTSVRTILNSHQLQLIGYNAETLSGNYRLAGNIDLAETGRVVAGTPGSYAGMWAPTGFVSLGTDGAGLTWNGSGYQLVGQITSGIYGFSGTIEGLYADTMGVQRNALLSNLTINRPTANNTGLVGVLSGAIRNVNVGGSVTGAQITGGLVGLMIGGPSGSTAGASPLLVNTNSAVNVTGTQLVGGLVGNATRRSQVYGTASGTVTGTNTVGGLVGSANRAVVEGAASGAVNGRSYVGGLIGQQFAGTTMGQATGTVTGTLAVGGLIGVLDGTATERGDATAVSSPQTVNGPSSDDRNFGRITANGTGRTVQQPVRSAE